MYKKKFQKYKIKYLELRNELIEIYGGELKELKEEEFSLVEERPRLVEDEQKGKLENQFQIQKMEQLKKDEMKDIKKIRRF